VLWDDFEMVPQNAHNLGMKAYLYTSIFDEGWALAPKKIREVSYHNDMHFQHVSWQSDFNGEHPEFAVVDRGGEKRQEGVLCLAYPEVRKHLIRRCQALMDDGNFDGLFICLRSQSKPADFADQYGFNEPVRNDYLERYGRDIWREDFDLHLWRDLQGSYLTIFLSELRSSFSNRDIEILVGAPRGKILGPPFGNATLHWDTWVQNGIIDGLVIDQNSSQCPSLWHRLWPMHRGYGYLQNYLDGYNMEALKDDLSQNYAPVFENQQQAAKLYLARQWHERSKIEEEALLGNPKVSGLVFSSFRHDNPESVKEKHWVV